MELEEMGSMDEIATRLSHLLGTAYSAHKIAMWGYSAQTLHLHFTSALHEDLWEKFFRIGGCYDYAFNEARHFTTPFLMSDKIGIIWMGENFSFGGEDLLALMGPMFYTGTSLDHVQTMLRNMVFDGEISNTEMATYQNVLKDVPVVSPETVAAYAKMLHFCIRMKALGAGDIHYQTENLQQASEAIRSDSRRWAEYTFVYNQEELLLQCVRDGNLNYLDILNEVRSFAPAFSLSGNPVRSEMYKLVANAALYTRAAIEGGLSPKTAYDLEASYLQKADQMTMVTELRELSIQMLGDFVHHVHEVKIHPKRSKHIQECCEYIETHLTDDLSIQKIAKEIGYAEYYLSRKFQKEMGVRLTEYIKDARLEYAKVCLISTQLSVEEISDLLRFNSRNYFTKTFREKTGKTPSEYRQRKVQEK